MDNFASLDTPGGPEGVRIVEIFVFEKYFSCFLDGGAAWRKKTVFLKSKPDVTFIILDAEKLALSLYIATIA